MKPLYPFLLVLLGCTTSTPPAKNNSAPPAEAPAIQKIEVVTQGGERGYYAVCTFTPDSVFHKLRIAVDAAANEDAARPAGEGEWQLLLQNTDLAEFKAAQDGPSALPVDGTDTEITITTDKETVSRSNAIGSPTWNGIDIWSQKRCMK